MWRRSQLAEGAVRLTCALQIPVETEEARISPPPRRFFKLKLLRAAYELLVVHDPGRVASVENPKHWWLYYEQGSRWSCTIGRV